MIINLNVIRYLIHYISFGVGMIKKILVIAYMFPPIAGGGTQRPLKFVKYLPEYGITPIVFCPQEAYWKAYDESLLNLPFIKSTKIYRCGVRRLRRYYNLRYKKGYKTHPLFFLMGLKSIWFLDFFSTWYFECRQKALEVIEKEKIDLIMTTSPPHSIHLFGLYLKKITNLPWIMDIRDAIVDDPNRPSTLIARIQDPFRYLHEKSFVTFSDAIITVSEPMSEAIRVRHRALKLKSKIQTIPNGFDEEDFTNVQISKEHRKCLLITYTGSFMGRQTPKYFLSAIQRLIEEKSLNPSDTLFRFVGHYDPAIIDLLKRFQKSVPLEVIGFQPYDKTLWHQLNSDLLLLIVNTETQNRDSQTMTGKFFEYIGAKRPLFALVPDGPLKETIQKGGFGYVVPPNSISQIAEKFKSIYDQWKKNGSISYDPDQRARSTFTRRHLTKELATVIDDICHSSA